MDVRPLIVCCVTEFETIFPDEFLFIQPKAPDTNTLQI